MNHQQTKQVVRGVAVGFSHGNLRTRHNYGFVEISEEKTKGRGSVVECVSPYGAHRSRMNPNTRTVNHDKGIKLVVMLRYIRSNACPI